MGDDAVKARVLLLEQQVGKLAQRQNEFQDMTRIALAQLKYQLQHVERPVMPPTFSGRLSWLLYGR